MNIGELARQAEVTPRTIRYYVEQGLLPPPERGYPAEYTTEHAERLDLIKLLKDERMPLEEIKATVQQLAPGEVHELLARAQARAATQMAAAPDSASEYVARVLDNARPREALLEPQMPKKAPPMLPHPVPPLLAMPGSVTPPVPAPASLPPPVPQQAPADAASPPTQDAGTWQRIQLTPSVEIHYQVNAADEHRNLVDRLVDLAARVLGRGSEKG